MAFKSTLNTYTSSEIASGTEVKADFDQVWAEGIKPENQEDCSADTSAFQATRDPYPGDVVSLPTNAREEQQTNRFEIVGITGETYHYEDPRSTLRKLYAGEHKLVSKTATYTATSDDCIILCDASGGPFTITLPTAVGITGKVYMIQKIDADPTSVKGVTIDPAGTETINGATTRYLLTKNEYLVIYSDGANWVILAEDIIPSVNFKTGNYTLTASDHSVLCDATSTALTITLPTAVGIKGTEYFIKKTDSSANAVTVDGNGSETLDGLTVITLLEQYKYVKLISDGTNWIITGQSSPKQILEHKNLVVKYATTGTVDVDADVLDVEDTSNRSYRLTSINLTLDITASGANGLDTGAEANSTSYAIWVIYNSSTVAGLLSTSFTAPTMPSGYTFKRLVGFVRNDSGGNFLAFYQNNERLLYDDPVDDTAVLTNGAATAFTDVDITNYAGSATISKQALIGWEFEELTDAAVDASANLRRNGASNNGRKLGKVRRDLTGSIHGAFASGECLIPLDATLIFEFKVSAATVDLDLWVHGLILDI